MGVVCPSNTLTPRECQGKRAARPTETWSPSALPCPQSGTTSPPAVGVLAATITKAADDLFAYVQTEADRTLTIRGSPVRGTVEAADGHVDLHVTPWARAIGDVASTLHSITHRWSITTH